MLTPRQAQLAFIPLAAGVMSGVISLAMTVLNRGFVPDLLAIWLHSWLVAFAIALPAAWAILPGVRTLLARLTQPGPVKPKGRQIGSMG